MHLPEPENVGLSLSLVWFLYPLWTAKLLLFNTLAPHAHPGYSSGQIAPAS